MFSIGYSKQSKNKLKMAFSSQRKKSSTDFDYLTSFFGRGIPRIPLFTPLGPVGGESSPVITPCN